MLTRTPELQIGRSALAWRSCLERAYQECSGRDLEDAYTEWHMQELWAYIRTQNRDVVKA